MVSKAKEDLPEPERPVNTISLLRGNSSDIFFRLCSRAPFMIILSLMFFIFSYQYFQLIPQYRRQLKVQTFGGFAHFTPFFLDEFVERLALFYLFVQAGKLQFQYFFYFFFAFDGESFHDVFDVLDYGLGSNAVFFVVLKLKRPAAIGLGNCS